MQWMLLTPNLSDAIEQLYGAFQRYGLRASTEPCPCCHSAEDKTRLHSKPLRQLSRGDLANFAMDALYVWGNEADFKHFLPRIFELLVLTEKVFSFVDAEAVFVKLMYEAHNSTSWRSWPLIEQEVITRYFRALWEAVLDSSPEELGFDDAYDWICAISQAEHDISPYLAVWLRAESVHAHRNLALMILQKGVPNLYKSGPGYWEKRREQWTQLVDWLRTPVVRTKLELAIERWADAPFAAEFLDAAVLLPSKSSHTS